MEAKWERWEPLPNLPDQFWLDSITYGKEGLALFFEDRSGDFEIKVLFQLPISFRMDDEGNRLRSIFSWSAEYENFCSWSLYKTTTSELIDWINEENYDIFKGDIGNFIRIFPGYYRREKTK